ncbi:hypothetical protein DPMN_086629 [Dreissena polymorpha]|uniref:Uncharacterized protein n=1 Tax=Dreissena polymorpha TaxID=45954 RepID=A0A9D4KR88_DREPO|nr:hypothetical protein DPMN_086629 [Dreissena polymorpha]
MSRYLINFFLDISQDRVTNRTKWVRVTGASQHTWQESRTFLPLNLERVVCMVYAPQKMLVVYYIKGSFCVEKDHINRSTYVFTLSRNLFNDTACSADVLAVNPR